MNLVNKEVFHKSFGKGSIVNHSDSIIEIHFATENKKFVFPDAFGKYLKLKDEGAAKSIELILEKKEIEREKEEKRKEEERKRRLEEYQLRLELEKLMKNHKLHPQSQMAFACDPEEDRDIFTDWKVYSGEIKSGANKGKPKKPSRLYPNSVCLLTKRDSSMSEKDRQIIGLYMVKEDFVGKFCEDGYITAHSTFKLQLTDEECKKMLFWNYCVNEKSPQRITWNSGKYRYFDNVWMAQILRDIISLKNDQEEKELAENFFDHFCKLNQIRKEELPEPNGALYHL